MVFGSPVLICPIIISAYSVQDDFRSLFVLCFVIYNTHINTYPRSFSVYNVYACIGTTSVSKPFQLFHEHKLVNVLLLTYVW